MAERHPMMGPHFHISNDIAELSMGFSEDEDENEMEDTQPGHQEGPFAQLKGLTAPELWRQTIRILSEVLDSSLEEQCKPFMQQLSKIDSKEPTFLHWIAKNGDQDLFNQLPSEKRRALARHNLERMAARHSSSSSLQSRKTASLKEDPIFTTAFQNKNYAFVKWVLDDFPEYAPMLLQAKSPGDGRNCIQALLRVMARMSPKKPKDLKELKEVTPLLKRLIEMATPQVLAQGDNKKVTALHVAMAYNLCRLPIAEYATVIIPKLIEKCDEIFKNAHREQFADGELSPYQYSVVTEQQYMSTRRENAKEARRTPPLKDPSAQDGSETEIKDKIAMSIQERSSKLKEEDPTMLNEKKQLLARATAPRQGEKDFHLTVVREKLTSAPRTPTGGVQHRASFCQPAMSENDHDDSPSSITKAKSRAHVGASEGNDKSESLDHPAHINDHGPEKTALAIRDYLSLHYIRTRSDLKAKELLKGMIASDRNLYLHASHLRGQKVNALLTLIEKLSQTGGLHETLSYVDLPLLISETSRENDQSGFSKANEGKQRHNPRDLPKKPPTVNNTLVPVFRSLVKAGVRTILRLHVEDRVETAHSDAAIEEALRGYDSVPKSSVDKPIGHLEVINVEVWDWKKFDISIDVIMFSAPKVVQINLHWKGNQSVLRGWASPEGIPRLHKDGGKVLKKVWIHAYPGVECKFRMQHTFKKFKQDLLRRTADEVEVDIVEFYPEGFTLRDKSDDKPNNPTSEDHDEHPTHKWITHMEKFRGVLRNLHGSLPSNCKPLPRIKVALIDDGADLTKLNAYNDIVRASGVSYFPPAESYLPSSGQTERPWHESTNGHGTVMANMIVRVNPWVDLDVMRIEDSPAGGLKGMPRKIYAETAARAINGAVDRKARIISVSWTIRSLVKENTKYSPSEDSEKTSSQLAIEKLEQAIKRALANRIAVFCSAADQIDSSADDWLPYGVDPAHIFLIGSATHQAKRDASSGSVKELNYYFPGNNVDEARNPRSAKPVEYHTGSSVSTALAAGLASLIIYLVDLVDNYYKVMRKTDKTPYRNYSNLQSLAAAFRDACEKNIRIAFGNIITYKDSDDPKFLPVWHLFGEYTSRLEKYTQSLNKDANSEEMMAELESLVQMLCKNVKS